MTTKNPLLERALAAKRGRGPSIKPNRDEVELAIEFLRGNITCKQFGAGLGRGSRQNAFQAIPSILRQALGHGIITITIKE